VFRLKLNRWLVRLRLGSVIARHVPGQADKVAFRVNDRGQGAG